MTPHPLPKPALGYRLMQAMMWPLLKLTGMTCRDVFQLCSADMDAPLTRSARFRLRTHLLMCGLCRRLPAQLANLRTWVRHCHEEKTGTQNNLPPLSQEARERILCHLHQHDH